MHQKMNIVRSGAVYFGNELPKPSREKIRKELIEKLPSVGYKAPLLPMGESDIVAYAFGPKFEFSITKEMRTPDSIVIFSGHADQTTDIRASLKRLGALEMGNSGALLYKGLKLWVLTPTNVSPMRPPLPPSPPEN